VKIHLSILGVVCNEGSRSTFEVSRINLKIKYDKNIVLQGKQMAEGLDERGKKDTF